MLEIWEEIHGYEELYEISNYGNIKRKDRIVHREKYGSYTKKGGIHYQSINPQGYKITSLVKNGKEKYQSIHRLVAGNYIPNPNNLPQINHKDGNKLNNRIENLEWCTSSDNISHAYKTGLRSGAGEKNNASKLSWDKVSKIRELYATGNYQYKDLGEMFGVTGGNISLIIKDKLWIDKGCLHETQ